MHTDDSGKFTSLKGSAEGHKAIRVSYREACELAGQCGLRAPCSVIDPCSTKRYWEMQSFLLFLFLFLTAGLGYRWQRLASQVGLEASWAWTTFSWPVSVLSKQRHPLEGLFRRAGCCRMLLSPLQQSSDQYPELPTWRVLAATWYLVFLLLHHCC